MSHRILHPIGVLAVVIAIMSLVPVPVVGQAATPNVGPSAAKPATPKPSAKAWTVPRTPDGQPDLRGMWVNFDSTPFETPSGAPPAPANTAGVNPPSHWADHDSPTSVRRQSMVVEPSDGRVPVKPWAEARRDYDLAHLADAPEHETPWVRCITRGVPGGMFPAGYNNAYEIMQSPGYVVIRAEMIHEARIIPLGQPHLSQSIRQWTGDSRGHWEGDTLVVDTTNFNDKGSIATSAATGRIRGIPQSEALHVIERFTRVGPDSIGYEVTIDDPKVYTQPWRVALPLNRDEKYQMYEYACHEGNLAMSNGLSGGRARDKAAETAQANKK